MRYVSYTKAVSWSRKNVDNTIPEQNEAISLWLKDNGGAALEKKYTDRKKDVEADAGFMEMIHDGMERKYDCIIVKDLTYLGNCLQAARHHILDTMYAAGIHLVVTDDHFDSSKVESKEVFQYFDAKRNEEHGDIFRNWLSQKGDAYLISNSIPYGYRRSPDGNNIIKDESISKIVDEMFRRHLEGDSFHTIAGWLNFERVDCPKIHRLKMFGKEIPEETEYWDDDKVRRIIRSPIYTGAVVNKKQEVVAEGCHEPYITLDVFKTIKMAKYVYAPRGDDGKIIKKNANFIRPYHGKLFCAKCGKSLVFSKSGKSRTGYRCSPGCWGKGDLDKWTIPEEEVYGRYKEKLLEEKKLAVKFMAVMQSGAYEKKRDEELDRISARFSRAVAELKVSMIDRVPLYDSYHEGKISKAEYEERLKLFQKRMKDSSSFYDETSEKVQKVKTAYSAGNQWLTLFCDIKVPDEADHVFIEKTIDRIELVMNSPYNPSGNDFSMEVQFAKSDWKRFLEGGI